MKLSTTVLTSKTNLLAVLPALITAFVGLYDHKLTIVQFAFAVCSALGLFGLRDQMARQGEAAQVQHEEKMAAASRSSTSLLDALRRVVGLVPSATIPIPSPDVINGIEQQVIQKVLDLIEPKVKEVLEKTLGRTIGDIVDRLVEKKLQDIVTAHIADSLEQKVATAPASSSPVEPNGEA